MGGTSFAFTAATGNLIPLSGRRVHLTSVGGGANNVGIDAAGAVDGQELDIVFTDAGSFVLLDGAGLYGNVAETFNVAAGGAQIATFMYFSVLGAWVLKSKQVVI